MFFHSALIICVSRELEVYWTSVCMCAYHRPSSVIAMSWILQDIKSLIPFSYPEPAPLPSVGSPAPDTSISLPNGLELASLLASAPVFDPVYILALSCLRSFVTWAVHSARRPFGTAWTLHRNTPLSALSSSHTLQSSKIQIG